MNCLLTDAEDESVLQNCSEVENDLFFNFKEPEQNGADIRTCCSYVK